MQNIEVDRYDYNGTPHVRLMQNCNAIHLHPSQLDLVMQWMAEVKDEIGVHTEESVAEEESVVEEESSLSFS